MASGKPTEPKKKRSFLKQVLLFFVLLLALYLYVVLANLSTAPQFIYTQF